MHTIVALRRNIAANFGSYAVTAVMGVAFIPVYIRFLGTEAYGLIGIFALLQTWLVLLDLGLVPALAREMARFTAGAYTPHSIRVLLRSVEALVVIVAGTIVLVVWGLSAWLASHWLHAQSLAVEQIASALTLMGVVIGLRLVENVYRSSLLGLQRQVAASVVAAVIATTRAIGAIAVIAWLSPTITAFFLWQAAVSVASVMAFAALLYRELPRSPLAARPSFNAVRGISRFAGGSVLITLTGTVLSQLDKVVLSSILTLSSFAVYSVAYMAAGAVRILAQPIDQAVYPRLTQLHHANDQAGLSTLYHRATQYSVVVMGGLAVFLVVYGSEVLRIWTQNPRLTASAAPILGILAVGMLLNGLMNGPFYLQMAAGWTGLLARTNVVMVVLLVPVIVTGVVVFGMVGAASGWVIINVVYVATVTVLMHRRLLPGEAVEWYLRDVAAPLAAGLLAALLLRPLVPANSSFIPAFLVVALLATIAAAALAAHRVRHDLVARFRERFQPIFGSDRTRDHKI